jgi:DNA-binding winged helix-turn-helix (wHTH) protein/TolB-like protein/tetratricopeptide (TPR) repeat protein
VPGPSYQFGAFQLNPDASLLSGAEGPIPLAPKVFETLQLLVENNGKTVSKDELLRRVWPDTFVEENSLTRNISTLRRALGDGENGSRFIVTVPKRGYRFVAPVQEVVNQAPGTIASTAAAPPASTNSRSAWIFSVAIVIVFAIGVAAYLASRRFPPRGSVGTGRVVLAVLPVQNLTGNDRQEYVSDGLTEEIISELGSLNPESLGVIARTSAMSYKQTNKSVVEIARELGADFILETSLRGNGSEVRFTAQLIRARDQTHMWAHSYERPINDVLALEGELARTVAREIQIMVTPQQEARLRTHPPVNPAAYDAFVQGRYHWNERSIKELQVAVGYFQQAIANDPDFAPAYAGLADSYAMLASMREYPPKEMMPKAKDALLRALALDDSLVEAHTSLGWIMEVFDWDWASSEKEFRKAIALDANDATAHHRYAIHLTAMGRFLEALSEIRQAQRLDPLSPVLMTSTGWVLLRARQPGQAISECQKALDLDPKFVRGHLCLGEVYEQQRDLNRAASEFLQAKTLAGGSARDLSAERNALETSGYAGFFRERLSELTEKSKHAYVSPYEFADVYIRLGEKDRAVQWLEGAYGERCPYLVNLQIEPRMDFLRSDPRFQDLLRRLGLADIRVSTVRGD